MSLSFFLLASSASAGWYTSGSWSTAADEGTYEVFGHACDDWSGTGNTNLTATISGLELWIDWMGLAGYANYKYGTDANAWASAWEQASSDDSYADAADFAYVSTHGASDSVAFNGSSGDDALTSSETRWGNGDNEAVAIDACKVLDSTGRSRFGTANKNDGSHYIFGFSSNSLDTDTTADFYGMYLESGYSLKNAWKYATQAGHLSSYTGAYVRFYSASCNTSTDTAYAASCDPKSGSSAATSTWAL